MLLELQKKKAMETELQNKVVYVNGSFEKNENHVGSETEYATTQPVAASAEPEQADLEHKMTPEPSTEEHTSCIQEGTCL